MIEELSFTRGETAIRATLYGRVAPVVLLCPPHPLYGGNREDNRLVKIAQALVDSGSGALCLDYSSYTGGLMETEDVVFILQWLNEKGSAPGLAGYSYGALIAANAAKRFHPIRGLVLIAPLKRSGDLSIDLKISGEKLIIYGRRDYLVGPDVEGLCLTALGPVRKLSLDTDHFFTGYEAILATTVAGFFKEIFMEPVIPDSLERPGNNA